MASSARLRVGRGVPQPDTRPLLAITPDEWVEIATRLNLSSRESVITRRLLDNTSEADIAMELSIAARTVHAHLERLYKKLTVHSRSELIVRVFVEYVSCRRARS